MAENNIQAQLVDEFAQLEESRIATPTRNHRLANRYARAQVAVFLRLVSFGDVGRDAFARLLKHSSRGVRCTAAAFLLRYKHDEAVAVLEELANGDDFCGFQAQQAMERWRDGSWQLDPG